ncbi:MAG TPA: hypothetical protein GX530_10225 [Corynebacteriales bacterium]|nr:hypothetical protein [Mycobacteriales bacterium]
MSQTRRALTQLMKEVAIPQITTAVIEAVNNEERTYDISYMGGTGNWVVASAAKRSWWNQPFTPTYKVGDTVLVNVAEDMDPVIVSRYADESQAVKDASNTLEATVSDPTNALAIRW